MKSHANLTVDPVCLRRLESTVAKHQLIYKGLSYQFCSAHCLERFVEIPEYFIAPRRREANQAVLKEHRLRFSPVAASIRENAVERLHLLQGVIRASASEKYVDLEYDLRLVGLQQIEALLANAGLPLKGGIHRLLRNFWVFSEHNELANFASQPSPCCSRPPVRLR